MPVRAFFTARQSQLAFGRLTKFGYVLITIIVNTQVALTFASRQSENADEPVQEVAATHLRT